MMSVIASSENVRAISSNAMMASAFHKFGFAMVFNELDFIWNLNHLNELFSRKYACLTCTNDIFQAIMTVQQTKMSKIAKIVNVPKMSSGTFC